MTIKGYYYYYIFLNSPERTLEISFRVTHGESSFMIYASTDSMRCFECRDLGHKRFTCPHKNEQSASTSRAETNNTETPRSQERVKGVTDEVRGQQEVSELNVNIGDVEKPRCSTAVDKDVSVCDDVDEHEAQSDTEDVCEGVVAGEAGASEGNMVDEMEDSSQCTDDGSRDDVEQWSDAAKMMNCLNRNASVLRST